MSPSIEFPPDAAPRNAITKRVLGHPQVTARLENDALVLAIKDQLLVRSAALAAVPELRRALDPIARSAGRLSETPYGDRPTIDTVDDVELWQLTAHTADSITTADTLRELVPTRFQAVDDRQPPAVSPNHVCVVSPRYDTCPASPPSPAEAADGFISELRGRAACRVVVIDTGYVHTSPPNAALDSHVTPVLGTWYDAAASPPAWVASSQDLLDADGDHQLDGVAGHGTFIAGLIAHGCPPAAITVVGQRHDVLPLGDGPGDSAMLFSTEYDVAHALLTSAAADVGVILCGFAFPTLRGHASIPFTSVIDALTGRSAASPGLAIVAPAGNEESPAPYWPAAHRNVIGVAATDRSGALRADFSNWGTWVNCCTRGEDVRSTFVDWSGGVEDAPTAGTETFAGWACWSGTSFAAPKVAAAIAKLVSESSVRLLPTDAFRELIGGRGGVGVSLLNDRTVVPTGVTLPSLDLG